MSTAGLVRAFSDDWKFKEPNNDLSRGLAAKVEKDRQNDADGVRFRNGWNLLFIDAAKLAEEVPSEDESLFEQSCALALAWEKFVAKLPKDQQEVVRGRPPLLSAVRDTVHSAMITWKDKRNKTTWGRTKRAFERMCRSCSDYSDLLSIIPNDDKYISLLAGSLQAVAKATMRNQEIADGIAESLNQLCDEIRYWKKMMNVHQESVPMQRYVRDLYVVVFEFFTELFTEWSASSRKRLFHSFDSRAFNHLFTTKKEKMKELSNKLEREANLETQWRIQQMTQSFGTFTAEKNSTYDEMTKLEALIQKQLLNLGTSGQRFLEQSDLSGGALPTTRLLQTTSDTRLQTYNDDLSYTLNGDCAEDESEYLRKALLDCHVVVRRMILEKDAVVRQLGTCASSLQADIRVVVALQAWMQEVTARRIWIQGPPDVVLPSQNTLTAIRIIAAAEESHVPLVAYFCNTDLEQKRSEPADLLRMVQSLVAQLIRFVPERFTTDMNLSKGRLSACFEVGAAFAQVLQMFQDLFSLIPNTIICVIDGIQVLEQRSDREHTKRLRQTIQAMCIDMCDGQILKTCFTTDGYVDTLSIAASEGMLEKTVFDCEADLDISDDTTYLQTLRFHT